MDLFGDIIIKVMLITVWIMAISLALFFTPLRDIAIYPFIAGAGVTAIIAIGLLISLTIEEFKS